MFLNNNNICIQFLYNNQNNTPDFPAQYYHAAIDEDDK